MTKISSSPACRCRGSRAPGPKRVIWARRFVAGSSHRILKLMPGRNSCQPRSLVEMMRERGVVVVMVSASGEGAARRVPGCYSRCMRKTIRKRARLGSGEEHAGRLQRAVEGMQHEAEDLQRDDTQECFVAGFTQDDRRVALRLVAAGCSTRTRRARSACRRRERTSTSGAGP